MIPSYDDIIHHPHHVSQKHPRMSMHDRAAQFSAFAALVGYEDAVDEAGRLTEQRHELDEQEVAELNRRLVFLASRLDEHPVVTIRYYVPDKRKAGGAYANKTGVVSRIASSDQTLTMEDGQIIRLSDIVSVSGDVFDTEGLEFS